MSALTVTVTVVAVWRLTRLLTADYALEWLRRRIAKTTPGRDAGEGWDDRPTLGYLVTCPWCMSVYVGAITAAVVVAWPDNRVVFAVLLALAASGVTGLLATIEQKLTPPPVE